MAAIRRAKSVVPFAAVLAKRTTLSLGEIGLWRWLVVLISFGALVVAPPYIFGVPALYFLAR